MGRIAHIQLECPNCRKTTAAYVEESDAARANVRCEHCSTIFEFGPGMMYNPVGYVSEMPSWAVIAEPGQDRQSEASKRWWEFWK